MQAKPLLGKSNPWGPSNYTGSIPDEKRIFNALVNVLNELLVPKIELPLIVKL